jgi:hypothetical protein
MARHLTRHVVSSMSRPVAEDGTRRKVPLASATRIPFAGMQPSRRFKARKGQQTCPVAGGPMPSRQSYALATALSAPASCSWRGICPAGGTGHLPEGDGQPVMPGRRRAGHRAGLARAGRGRVGPGRDSDPAGAVARDDGAAVSSARPAERRVHRWRRSGVLGSARAAPSTQSQVSPGPSTGRWTSR